MLVGARGTRVRLRCAGTAAVPRMRACLEVHASVGFVGGWLPWIKQAEAIEDALCVLPKAC